MALTFTGASGIRSSHLAADSRSVAQRTEAGASPRGSFSDSQACAAWHGPGWSEAGFTSPVAFGRDPSYVAGVKLQPHSYVSRRSPMRSGRTSPADQCSWSNASGSGPSSRAHIQVPAACRWARLPYYGIVSLLLEKVPCSPCGSEPALHSHRPAQP